MGDWHKPAVRFEVLGPLRAWQANALIPLGPVQQRVVLAVLLTHANRPVGRQQLVEAVWGDAVPASAVNLVQRHVSAIRRGLDPDRSDRAASSQLKWTDAGYVLEVADGDLDLDVFDGGVRRARAARNAGDVAAAAEALHGALRLWRGPAFDGLASPFLDAQREALAERRLTVVEDRIEVDLLLGDHPDLIAELRELVAEHPLQERLRELLMLALHRGDRQADALTVFREARQVLRGELGIEPAARLQELHRRILAGEPIGSVVGKDALRAAAPSAATVVMAASDPGVATRPQISATAPAQLPHNLHHFTGRDTEIEWLNALVSDDGPVGAVAITAIAGTAGVGKTALAVHWAHQIKGRFTDGQLYVNLRGFGPAASVMEPGEAIRGFLDAFGVPPPQIPISLDAQAALYRSLLADRRVLIVLDNARDADQVRPLLPGSPGCLVIVTSRNSLTSLVAVDGAHPLVVDLLGAAEARQLLTKRLGNHRVESEPEAVEVVITACAGLPLALAIVAARAAIQPRFRLAVLAAEILKARGRLDPFIADDVSTDIRAVFSWSYEQLSAAGARLFRLLGHYPGPDLASPAVASLAGVPIGEARQLLAELTRAHLITEHAPDRFTLHDLLRYYAAEQGRGTDSELEQRAALHRVLDHYVHTAHAASRMLDPQVEPIDLGSPQSGVTIVGAADHEEALAWFTTEHAVLLGVVDAAASARLDTQTWRLACVLVTYLDRRGHWRDAVGSQSAALTAVTRLADTPGRAVTHRRLARAYAQLGRYDEAHLHLRHALELFTALEDHEGQAQTHYALAHVFYRQGRHREALTHADRALVLHRANGHRAGEAAGLNAVGWFHALLGDYQRALAECQQALALHQELGDRYGLAATWDSIGYVHHHLGSHSQAQDCYQHALRLWRELGDRFNEADTLARLGDSRHATGDREAGRYAWRLAQDILDELGHPDAAVVRGKLS